MPHTPADPQVKVSLTPLPVGDRQKQAMAYVAIPDQVCVSRFLLH
jgi:hypothetical protein